MGEGLKNERKKADLSWQVDTTYTQGKLDDFLFLGPVAVDIETTGLSHDTDHIVGISVSWMPANAHYIPVAHRAALNEPINDIISRLNTYIKAGGIILYFNAKFDRAFLNKAGLNDQGSFKDVQIELYSHSAHLFLGAAGLKGLAKKVLGLDMMPMEELFNTTKAEMKRNPPNFATLPVDGRTLSYACADADMTYRLFEYSEAKRTEKSSMISNLDHAVVAAIQSMERNGITIDVEKLTQIGLTIEDEREKLSAAIKAVGGQELNIGSPKQLAKHLFEVRGLEPIIRTDKDAPSTSTRALRALQRKYGKKYKELNWVIEYRKLDTLRKSYVKPISKGVKPGTSKIFPQFKVASLVTGRISSTGDGVYLEKLNFQGIPKNLTEQGFNIRECFVAAPGYTWCSIDLASIELRLIAEFSRDPKLIEAVCGDMHSQTARLIFNKGEDDPEFKRYRKIAKILNFNLAYAFGIHALRSKLEEEMGKKVGEQECWDLYNKFFQKAYPKWDQYKKDLCSKARKEGIAYTMWGRARDLSELYGASDNYFGCAGDRAAVNHPIQGTAADLMRRALVKCDHYTHWLGNQDVRMLNTVHDEINFEIRNNMVGVAVPALTKIISWTPKDFIVHLEAVAEVGPNWGKGEVYGED